MSHYRDDHQRVLTWVAEQRWMAFGSDDQGLVRACVYSGFMVARYVPGHPGKTRLALTTRGQAYLDELQTLDRPTTDEPMSLPRRREVDHSSAAH